MTTKRTKASITRELKAAINEQLKLTLAEPVEVVELRAALILAQAKHRQEILPRVDELSSIQKELRSELVAMKKATTKPVHPAVTEYIKRISHGVDWGHGGLRQAWVSDDGKYAVISCGGTMYTSGMERLYGQSNHFLVDLAKVAAYKGNNGYRLQADTMIGAEILGRINKQKLSELIARIPKES